MLSLNRTVMAISFYAAYPMADEQALYKFLEKRGALQPLPVHVITFCGLATPVTSTTNVKRSSPFSLSVVGKFSQFLLVSNRR